MDDQRIEQVLREGPPFATAYVAHPLPIDGAIAEHRGLTGRRLVLALLTTALLLAAALAALVVLGLLRGKDPGPLVILRSDIVWVHPIDGSSERQILPGVPDGSGGWCPDTSQVTPRGGSICGLVQHLTMSADGRRLVLSVYRTEPSNASESDDLYVLNVDGSGLRLVHHEPTGQFDFALAPDGHRLVYAAGLPQAQGTRMGILDIDSGEQLGLPDGGTPMMWSPDGGSIAFATRQVTRRLAMRRGSSMRADSMLDSSGSTSPWPGPPTHGLSLSPGPSEGRMSRPSWSPSTDHPRPLNAWHLGATDSLAPSPDGRQVAIVQTTDQPGQLRIALADRGGSDPVVISPIKGDGARVCWSADGRWLFWLVSHNLSPETEFFAYDVANGSTRMLVHWHATGERAIYAPGC